MPTLERGKKKGRDQYLNASESTEQLLNLQDSAGPKRGMYCQRIDEPVPELDPAPCEKVIRQPAKARNNCEIVLGRDRPASLASGYGGKGQTQCGMIDIVVGRGGSFKNKDGIKGVPDKDVHVSPNFFTDAARIYISQKCDIDDYFSLAQGSERVHPVNGRSSIGRSGIGIKADHVRVIARRHIKLVTCRAPIEGAGLLGESLSTGGENFGDPGGIDFIAGNYTDDETVSTLGKLTKIIGFDEPLFEGNRVAKLQPLVKGDNLVECIRWIDKILRNLSAMILSNSAAIGNIGATSKIFMSTFPLRPGMRVIRAAMNAPVIKSIQTLAATINNTVNSVGLQANFLNPGSPLYINSRHVRTT